MFEALNFYPDLRRGARKVEFLSLVALVLFFKMSSVSIY